MKQADKEILSASEKLGALLKKERSPEDQQRIEQILKEEKNLKIRVQLIEELDQSRMKRLADEDIKGSKSNIETGNFAPNKRFATTSFFKYLFGTRKNLSNFASRTGALSSKPFSTEYALSGQAIAIFKKNSQKNLASIYKKLKSEIIIAWQNINILDFNILMYFYQAIEGFYHLCSAIQSGNRNVDKLLKMGHKFFYSYMTLDQDVIYLNRLKKILEFIFSGADKQAYLPEVKAIYNFIFAKEHKDRSLDIKIVLQGLFSLTYKKVLTIEEIDLAYSIKAINKDEHNVPPDMKSTINSYFRHLETDFDQVDLEIYRIQMIKKELLSQNKEGKFIFPIFKNILTKVFQQSGVFDEQLSEEIKKVLSNSLFLVKELNSYIINHLSPIMRSKIFISSSGTQLAVYIFQHTLFEDELQKLNVFLGEIEKLLKKFPNLQFPFNRFFEGFKKPFDSGTPEEIASRLCINSIEIYYSMGEKFLQVLLNHGEAEKMNIKEKTSLKKRSNEPIIDFEKRARFIPYYSDKIISKGIMSQSTPFGIIIELSQIFYNIALVFRHDPLLKILRNEGNLLSKKNKINKSLSLSRSR